MMSATRLPPMEPPMRTMIPQPQAFQSFSNHIHNHLELGVTCEGRDQRYVPRIVLEEYWTDRNIVETCRQAGVKPISTPTIRKQFLCLFSILVDIKRLDILDNLVVESKNDHTLPWTEPPAILRQDNCRGVWENFFACQWKFCPVLINLEDQMSDTKHHKMRILPFTKIETNLRPGNGATGQPVLVHPAAHTHLKQQIPLKAFLKSYPPEHRHEYEGERTVHGAFSGRDLNIVRCLGSYHWLDEKKNRHSTIIFENAPHGSLLDFFRKAWSPYEFDEINGLWAGILEVIGSLEALHNGIESKGIHHDLKPDNILVFDNDKLGSKYEYLFKIADFGASQLTATDGPEYYPQAVDRLTSPTYGPPEVALNHKVRYPVHSSYDLWSIGCIIIETAIWISLGEQARQRFRESRMVENSNNSNLMNIGRQDCFHNGSTRLDCIAAFYDKIIRHGRHGDDLTPRIFELALNGLLVEKNSRFDVRLLYSRMNEIVHPTAPRKRFTNGSQISTHFSSQPIVTNNSYGESNTSPIGTAVYSPTRIQEEQLPYPDRSSSFQAEHELPGSTIRVQTIRPISTFENGSGSSIQAPEGPPPGKSSSPFAFVTINKLETWKKKIKTTLGKSEILPGWDDVQGQLKGRDFVIVIDNSRWMQDHKDEVLKFVECLTYLIKQLDPDGAEFLCTSRFIQGTKRIKTAQNASEYVNGIFSEGKNADCNMEGALSQVLLPIREQLRNRRTGTGLLNRTASLRGASKKGVSVLVFTDGVWDHSTHGVSGVDGTIQTLINDMKTYNIDRSNIAIQFLQFGSSSVGAERLRVLDDDLAKREQNIGFDIVDHKRTTAGVWDILVGSVFAIIDDSN